MAFLSELPYRRALSTLALAAALAAAGCSSVTKTPPASSPADQRAAAPAALSTERQWLQQWFKDTPVRIEQLRDGPITVEVPREFCFDAGRSDIKPPLAAVLDKVAESLRRTPQARVALLAAPDDAAGSPLAAQRAAQVQKRLLSRGVLVERMVKPTAATVAAVQLRLEAATAMP